MQIRSPSVTGSLEHGKYADIIAVQGDPLTEIKVMEKVTFGKKEGKVFKQRTYYQYLTQIRTFSQNHAILPSKQLVNWLLQSSHRHKNLPLIITGRNSTC